MDQPRVAFRSLDVRRVSIGGVGGINSLLRRNHCHYFMAGLHTLPGTSIYCRNIHGMGCGGVGSYLGSPATNVHSATCQHLSFSAGAFRQTSWHPMVDGAVDVTLGKSSWRIFR